jgi:predicted nucleic acid-binding protein
VIVSAVADDGDDGDRTRARLRSQRLVAPELLDLEVLSGLRSLVASGDVDNRRARLALDDFTSLDIGRVGHYALIERVWRLRENLTPYDAAYVAVAEALAVVLVTGDSALAHAPGPRCTIELLA